MGKLLKTRIRGGILTLTDRELVLGQGWLGTQHVRRYPIQGLAAVELQPSPDDQVLNRSILLRLRWHDGQIIEVDGLGPIAADRVRNILQALCGIDIQ